MVDIRVIYNDGSVGTVPAGSLEYRIARKEIHAFQRADGWILIEQGPLRKDYQSSSYAGHKKRQADYDNHVG
jgi:hypothetical protein